MQVCSASKLTLNFTFWVVTLRRNGLSEVNKVSATQTAQGTVSSNLMKLIYNSIYRPVSHAAVGICIYIRLLLQLGQQFA